MYKKMISILMTMVFIFSLTQNIVLANNYKDVSAEHWAYNDINKAISLGILEGKSESEFGIGENVKRGEFVLMLSKTFQWDMISPEKSSFTDNSDKLKRYYSAIETALKYDVIKNEEQFFRPEENITREETAVMLVRALGYDTLAGLIKEHSFTDVTEYKGYITMVNDFGFISGKTSNTFEPKGHITKEQMASILVRTYEKVNSKIDFLHGFYAFSSWDQKEMAAKMDGISFGWSRMSYSPEKGVVLNTTAADNNEWKMPSGYEEAADYMKQNNVDTNLNVYMAATDIVSLSDGSNSNVCKEILLNSERRIQAVNAIISELSKIHEEAGRNIYSGVTIDFENMRGNELKSGFNSFLAELKSELNKIDKKLYVAIQPKLNTGAYYDGYDYYKIGELADKVILMAHDYQANTLTPELMETGFTATPVTPFDQIYYSLLAITDASTGVQDKSKIVLAISIGSAGWVKKEGKVTNSVSIKPSMADIYNQIKQGAVVKYSDKYKNPNITYKSGDTETIVWYEDSRSIIDKVKLARMFGINGLSIWRLGIVPNYDEQSNFNVWNQIQEERS